jgi:MFS family permease
MVANLLDHRAGRTIFFTALYFSEGAPIGLIWWALPTLLRIEGVAIGSITGLTAVLVLPWTLKFLWSPLVDALRSKHWGFRAWIVSAQLGMGLTIVPLIWMDPAQHFGWWKLLLLTHAFMAATQDVAIDAFAINVVPEHDRGSLNGSMQAGMLTGRSLFGGGALLVASTLGHEWILIALVACIWSTMALLLFVHEPTGSEAPRRKFSEFAGQLRLAATRRSTWYGLGFALMGGAAFESAGLLAGPFLVDRGVSQETIGVFFGLVVVLATVTGGLIGGPLSDRWGRAHSVRLFLLGFVATISVLGVLDLSPVVAPHAVLLGILGVTYFFIGLFTAASYALFMDRTEARIAGTQFSTFMSATNGCEAWTGWAGGQVAGRVSFGASFLVMCAVSLVSLPLLKRFGRERNGSQSGSS